MMKELTDKR